MVALICSHIFRSCVWLWTHFHAIVSNDLSETTRDVFYVRREVDLMKTAKVNAYIMHIFGKIELLSIYAT